MKRLLFTLLFGLGLYGFALAQGRDVSGRVTDAKGEGIPGASVLIKGTTTGTSTDLDGNFKLKVGSDLDVLVFSSVGLTTKEIVVGSQSSFNLTLEDEAKILDGNVVITGYREIDRTRVTGQASSIDRKLIENVPVSSFDQILQGRSPGVLVLASSGQPGAPAAVRIRGLGTISGSNAPLYILDGIAITAGDFATLNSNDFERMDVLKDATATSIYGSRGANGVIVITSKRGTSGKPVVTYNVQQGWTTRTNTRFNMMNTAEKIQFERLSATQGVVRGRAGSILAGPGTPQQKENQIADLAKTDIFWPDYMFRVGQMQMHELSVAGGTEKTKYFISGSYRKEDGILIKSNLERYNLRMNIDQEITKDLKFGISSSFGYSSQSSLPDEGNGASTAASPVNPTATAFYNNPYFSPFNADGTFSTPAPINQGGPFGNANMIQTYDYLNNKSSQLKIVGNIFAEYMIPKVSGLSLRASVGMDYSNDEGTNMLAGNTPYPVYGSQAGNNGYLGRAFSKVQVGTSNLLFKYNRTFNKDHFVSAVLGGEIIERRLYSAGFERYGLSTQVPFPQIINDPITGSPDANFPVQSLTNTEARNNIVSAFIDANYSYQSKYNVSFGGRRDGSSRFGSNRRFAYFYAIGASWNVHEENFFESIKKLTKITTLTLRTSYGTVGNQEFASGSSDAGNFRYVSTYSQQGNYNGITGIAPTSIPNPNLGWEKSENWGIGGDIAFLSNRFVLTVDYYDRKTSDLLVPRLLPLSTSFASQTVNAGQISNKGWEFRLQGDILRLGSNNAFVWNFDANITYNKNVVTNLGGNTRLFFDDGTAFLEGQPARTQYDVRWAGVNPQTGNNQFYDLEGNIAPFVAANSGYDPANRVPLGTSQPPIFGGFTNTFTFNQRLSLSIFCSYASGHTLENNGVFTFNTAGASQSGFGNKDRRALNMWTTPGQITDVPRAAAGTNGLIVGSRFMQPGDFIRIRNVQLSYNFPDAAFKSVRLSGLRVYIQAQNLFTFTNYDGLDPENSLGSEFYNFPVPRVFNIGATVKF